MEKKHKAPKQSLQHFAFILGILNLPIWLLWAIFAYYLSSSAAATYDTLYIGLLFIHPVIAFLYYIWANLKWLWLGTLLLIILLVLAEYVEDSQKTKLHCDFLQSQCTQLEQSTWSCLPKTHPEFKSPELFVYQNCGLFSDKQTITVPNATLNKAVNTDQPQPLQGIFMLPENFQTMQDIKLKVWTESGNGGRGYAGLWTIRVGEVQTPFSVPLSGPNPDGYKIRYICEHGCSGIVNAYYDPQGSVSSQQKAVTLYDRQTPQKIRFHILLGDKITGSIKLMDGPAKQDIKLSIFIDDELRNIGKSESLPIIIPTGRQSVRFGLGLPSKLANRWRLGLNCNAGCVEGCEQYACSAYYSDGYYHPAGLVQDAYDSEIITGGHGQHFDFLLFPK